MKFACVDSKYIKEKEKETYITQRLKNPVQVYFRHLQVVLYSVINEKRRQYIYHIDKSNIVIIA